MLNIKRVSNLTTLFVVLAGLIFSPYAFADDKDDVLAMVYQYGDLENDLEAQAKLMRSDRVYITGGHASNGRGKKHGQSDCRSQGGRGSEWRKNEVCYDNPRTSGLYTRGRRSGQFRAMVECLSAQSGIGYDCTNMGYIGPDQGKCRLAYQAHAPVAAPRQLEDWIAAGLLRRDGDRFDFDQEDRSRESFNLHQCAGRRVFAEVLAANG